MARAAVQSQKSKGRKKPGPKPGTKKAAAQLKGAGVKQTDVQRPSRRDELARAERSMTKKLQHCDREALKFAVGKTTKMKPQDFVVCYGLRKLAKPTDYLSSKFWASFMEEFNVTADLFESLPPANKELSVADMLLDALLPSQSENPAARDCQPFLAFMAYLEEELNLTEISVAICNSKPSCVVSATMSQAMLVSILKHISYFGIVNSQSCWWEAVSDDFDKVIAAWTRTELKTGVKRQRLLVSEADAFKPFLDPDALETVLQSWDAETKPPSRCIRKLMESEVGSVLFQQEACELELDAYIEKGEKALRDLESNGFLESEGKSFFLR